MKKYFLIAFAMCLMGIVTSCGDKEKSGEAIVLTPETTAIKGDLGDYFEVIDKEYTLSEGTFDPVISVEVKRTDADYAFDLNGVKPYGYSGQGITGHAGFGIEILDENGNLIEKMAATKGGLGGMYSGDDMIEALKLKAGETGIVRWSISVNDNQKPAKFRIISAIDIGDSSDSGYSDSGDDDDDSFSSSDDDDSFSSSSGSEDWDALLDEYENLVDKYIALLKKANQGDMSALAEYAGMMEQAQVLGEEMSGAQGEMSSAQWSRYSKILQKMTKAAQSM